MVFVSSSRLKFLVFIFAIIGSYLFASINEKAFICVPVADLTVEPYSKFSKSGTSIEDHYHKIPFSGSWEACRRAHQLLFNEVVTVLEERGAEVKVRITNFYFLKANESIPSDTYWTLKKNLAYFKNIKNSQSVESKLPQSISYKENNIEESVPNKAITLKKPFYDPITKEIYSVGTRFVITKQQATKGPYDKGHFEVFIYDQGSNKLITTQIPKLNCIRNYSKKPEDKVQNFVQVLRLWAHQKEGAIPYVLGGWSWTINSSNNDFEISKESQSKYSIHRKKWPQASKTGFDCMGIIGRAAQVCDIPFYIKNTTTLLKDLKPLKPGEKISDGDIIWYPGHVMVISSAKKGFVIEARGYERGEGKVQEVPIENIFKEVKNLSELNKQYFEKKPVTVLYSDDRPWKTFKRFKILRIRSIWNS